MGFTPRRFAPTCACRAWGGLGGAQEPANSEPSAPMSVNHKRSHCPDGKLNGIYPNGRKGRYCLSVATVGGLHHPKYVGSWKYPTRSWAEPNLSRGAAIERAQHGAGDRGGAVAA